MHEDVHQARREVRAVQSGGQENLRSRSTGQSGWTRRPQRHGEGHARRRHDPRRFAHDGQGKLRNFLFEQSRAQLKRILEVKRRAEVTSARFSFPGALLEENPALRFAAANERDVIVVEFVRKASGMDSRVRVTPRSGRGRRRKAHRAALRHYKPDFADQRAAPRVIDARAKVAPHLVQLLLPGLGVGGDFQAASLASHRTRMSRQSFSDDLRPCTGKPDESGVPMTELPRNSSQQIAGSFHELPAAFPSRAASVKCRSVAHSCNPAPESSTPIRARTSRSHARGRLLAHFALSARPGAGAKLPRSRRNAMPKARNSSAITTNTSQLASGPSKPPVRRSEPVHSVLSSLPTANSPALRPE